MEGRALATVDQNCATVSESQEFCDASARMMKIFAEAFQLHGGDWWNYASFVNERFNTLPKGEQDAMRAALQTILDFATQADQTRQSH